MDDANLSFDFLAKETFELGQNMNEHFAPGGFIFEEFSDNNSLREFPPSPGLIYYLDKGTSTFSVRAICSENIAESFAEFESNPGAIFKKFKIRDEGKQSLENISFFETDYIEQAEIVVDQLCFRRFPIEEDVLCNLSDPGYSWWLKESENGFSIYYKSHGINRASEFTKLGPIGDSRVFEKRFRHLLGHHAFQNCCLNSNEFTISVQQKYLGLKDSLLTLFKDGKIDETLMSDDFNNIDRTLYYFLYELASIRSFWIHLERELKSNPE